MFPGVVHLSDGRRLTAERRSDDDLYLQSEQGSWRAPVVDIAPLFLRFEPLAATGDADGRRGLGEDDPLAGATSITAPVVAKQFEGRSLALFAPLAAVAAVSNALSFALPLFTMAVYDRIVPHNAQETLWALTLGLIVVLCVDLALRMTRLRFQEGIGLGANLAMQTQLYKRLHDLDVAAAPQRPGPVSAAFQAVEGFCLATPQLAVGLLVDLPFVIATLAFIAFIGGPIVYAPIFCILAIIAVAAAAHLAGRRVLKESAALTVGRFAMIDETVASLEPAKTLGIGGSMQRVWRDLIDESAYQSHRVRLYSGFATHATTIIAQAATVGCLFIGVALINDGALTVGALVAITILVNRIVQPVTGLIGTAFRVAAVREAASAADALLRAPVETGGDATLGGDGANAVPGSIVMSGVTFSHPNAGRPTLKEVTASIDPGEKVAIIGAIGSGKSTFVKSVLRLHALEAGQVFLGGRDVRQFDRERLRRVISYMPQDCELFDDTLYENICVGIDHPSPERMRNALRASGVDRFCAAHPEGLSRRVGPHGRALSGGERQAVALARALMRDAPVLILDEPTAAMDSQLEQTIVERLKPAIAEQTLIVATHRAPILALVDRLIWLDAGRVVADGPKADVLARLSAQQTA